MLRLQVAKRRLQVRSQQLQDVLDEREKAIQIEHINERLHTGRYYRIAKDNEYALAFQVACKHPSRRSYVQRICFLGEDVLCLVVNVFLLVMLCLLLCTPMIVLLWTFSLWLFCVCTSITLYSFEAWDGCVAVNICAATEHVMDTVECQSPNCNFICTHNKLNPNFFPALEVAIREHHSDENPAPILWWID